MSAAGDIAWSRQLSGTSAGQMALWAAAAMIALAAHGGAAWWLTRQPPEMAADASEPTAIMIDLAPVPMAPAAEEEQITPDEVDSIAAEAPAPERVEPVETATAAEPVPVEAEAEPEAQPAEAVPVETAEAVETEEMTEAEPEQAQPVPVETVEETETDRAVPVDIEDAVQPEPEQAELVASEEATEVEPEIVEEIDPVEAMVIAELDRLDVPVPSARPAPTPPVRTEQPRRERQETPRPRQQQAAPARDAARAQVRSQQPAPRAAAPQTSQGSGSNVSPARWQSRLLAHLERRKRYPASARRQRQQGTAQVRFTIDANGNVQSVSLARSSGVPELDQEVVAMVRRASPVPAPPPGVNRTIVVPVRFSLR